VKKILVFLVLVFLITGCGSSYAAYNVGGRYYYTSEKQCPQHKVVGKYLACYSAEGKFLGYIRPMTNQEMMVHIYNKDVERVNTQRLADRITLGLLYR